VSEIAAIWVAGVAVLLLVGLTVGVFLRFTRVGREQELRFGDALKVLVVCVVFACSAYTLLVLVV
jgi:type III secretory pathway component EscS